MAIGNIQAFQTKVLAASGQVKASDGVLGGVLIGSGTGVTIKVWDSLTASGTVIVDTTVAATLTSPQYVPIPAGFSIGCFVTIGGTGSVTVFYL